MDRPRKSRPATTGKAPRTQQSATSSFHSKSNTSRPQGEHPAERSGNPDGPKVSNKDWRDRARPETGANPYGRRTEGQAARPAARSGARPEEGTRQKPERHSDAPAAKRRTARDSEAKRPAARTLTTKTPRPVQTRAMDAPKAKGTEIGARITRRASDRLRAGHLWVYASDIESIGLPEGGGVPNLLPVADNRGVLMGTALYSPASQIALRLISREAVSESQWLELLAERLRAAIGRRKRLLNAETDSARLCFSEADDLPGVVVDKYAGLVILQLLAKGLDSEAVRETCVRVLREELDPVMIVERPDPRMRELEGLSAPNNEPLYVRDGSASGEAVEFLLNGLKFHFDANSGQKTGAFLDQRSNYAAVRDWAAKLGATGRALDVCTYQGGFALHLAEVCGQVTGIDASHSSLEVAERNLESNRSRLTGAVDWVEADAFQFLRDWSDKGEKFDTIVLDPPAFAKTQRAVESALRGYKELNLRALRMLRAGGLLATFSCSHHVEWVDLETAVASAAHDAGRRVRVLERRGASLDHPVVLNLPETEYLKCLILEVE